MHESDIGISRPINFGRERRRNLDEPSFSSARLQLDWLIRSMSHGGEVPVGELQWHFSDAFLEQVHVFHVQQTLGAMAMHLAPMAVERVEAISSPCELQGLVRVRSGALWRFNITTRPEGSNPIASLFMAQADDQNVNRARAIEEDEVGMTITDPYSGMPIPGASVMLLDRATGQPFPHKVCGSADAYGYIRLRPPFESYEVGVQIVRGDGQTTLHYSPFLAAGIDGLSLPAFSRGHLDACLACAGAEVDARTGHIWGVLQCIDPDPNTTSRGFSATFVDVEALTDVYCPTPSDGLPDPAQSGRGEHFSTWWAFNVAPGAREVTLKADGVTRQCQIPDVPPESFVVLHTPILSKEARSH